MIGQKYLLNWANTVEVFPHFIVLVGERGSGKRTVAKEMAHIIGAVYAECDSKVDTVRDVIDTAYQSNTKVMYCFADADNMKPQAKNAMLKVTEEPPENAYFCLTVTNSRALLTTIRSRAYVFNMAPYTHQELREYYDSKYYGVDIDYSDLVICKTPYEVDKLCEYGKEFIEYVNLVIDNIAEVESANAFKSAKKLALKNDDGYDLKLFWQCFSNICVERWNVHNLGSALHYAHGVLVTEDALGVLNQLGVNKQQLYDKWTFDIREAWL